MDWLYAIIDLFLHLDRHLDALIRDYGVWTYLILFLVIFAETGLVFTPLLPGDSLLFAAGALAGRETLNPHVLFGLLASAAIIGDNSNYWIGRYLGRRLLRADKPRFFRREYYERTHAFFEKYGTKAIIIARFVPIVRTFTPFVAGVGAMTYRRFLPFDIAGGVLWVGLCVYAGYGFGSRPLVRDNFSLAVAAIIFVSLLPGVIEYVRHRRARARAARAADRV